MLDSSENSQRMDSHVMKSREFSSICWLHPWIRWVCCCDLKFNFAKFSHFSHRARASIVCNSQPTPHCFCSITLPRIRTSKRSMIQYYIQQMKRDSNLITFQTNDYRRLRSVAKTTDDVEFPLMRGALREILRLYPTATFLTRILDVDAEFGNFIVPKGQIELTRRNVFWSYLLFIFSFPFSAPTLSHPFIQFDFNFVFLSCSGCAVASSMYTAGRCPENYPDPLRFWPDRWLRNDSKAYTMVLKPQVFVPFAIGARSCVGRKVATFEISCLMSKVSELKVLLDSLFLLLFLRFHFTPTQILRNFTLESMNVFDVGMKVEMMPVPDQRISIDFTKIWISIWILDFSVSVCRQKRAECWASFTSFI